MKKILFLLQPSSSADSVPAVVFVKEIEIEKSSFWDEYTHPRPSTVHVAYATLPGNGAKVWGVPIGATHHVDFKIKECAFCAQKCDYAGSVIFLTAPSSLKIAPNGKPEEQERCTEKHYPIFEADGWETFNLDHERIKDIMIGLLS